MPFLANRADRGSENRPEAGGISDLRRLATEASAFVAGMADGIHGGLFPGGDNRPALERLRRGLARRHPSADPAYLNVRIWTMLTWQPVLLALLAVHRLNFAPRLDALGQGVDEHGVIGYNLPEGGDRGEEQELIALAGARVRHLSDGLLAEIPASWRINAGLARSLLADRTLALLLCFHENGWLTPAARVCRLGEAWAGSMGLDVPGRLVSCASGDRCDRLQLHRGGCCLECTLDGGRICDGCPKERRRLSRNRNRAKKANHV